MPTRGEPAPATVLAISDPSQVGEARRAAAGLGHRLGLDEPLAGKLALIATEAAGNLIKHAGGGELVIRALGGARAARRGDVRARPRSGHRRRGAVAAGRLLHVGHARHRPRRDPAAVERVRPLFRARARHRDLLPRLGRRRPARHVPRADGRHEPAQAEGDGLRATPGKWRHRPQGARVLVVDGIGHGPEAHLAARRAVDAAAAEPGGPGAVVEACHHALRAARGAALAVAELNTERGTGPVRGRRQRDRGGAGRAAAAEHGVGQRHRRARSPARRASSTTPGRPAACSSWPATAWAPAGRSTTTPGWRRAIPPWSRPSSIATTRAGATT